MSGLNHHNDLNKHLYIQSSPCVPEAIIVVQSCSVNHTAALAHTFVH